MNFLPHQLQYFLQNRKAKTNIGRLFRFLIVLGVIIFLYSVTFHVIMGMEGEQYSWLTGVYWTLTVMSTLGFGDITFTSDIGRAFSIFVLLSGIVFLLVLLPFTFIQFFYAPWMEAQNRSKTPRSLPENVSKHVLITNYDPITRELIEKLKDYGYSYYLLTGDQQAAIQYSELGLPVMVGDLDDPLTYINARFGKSAMLVNSSNDMMNTNITFTAREISDSVPVVSIANSPDSVDILKLAGSNQVIQLGIMMGQSLGRRTLGGSARVHVIGRFDKLIIGEAMATGTPLVGKTLAASRLREVVGVNVIGLWERGVFTQALPDSVITERTVLVLAGSVEQLRNYDDYFGIYNVKDGPVIVIGAGKVGRATTKSLIDRQMDYIIIDKDPVQAQKCSNFIVGDAADREVLNRAGIDKAHTVIITTHDDDTNIYLTLYCRRLRPDIQITARSTLNRNVSTLHRAGADFVMSYASMGAYAIFNTLERDEVLMIAEGLNVFKLNVPKLLVGQNLIESDIRKRTGCSVVAYMLNSEMVINPEPSMVFQKDMMIVLIGSYESEKAFIDAFSN